MVDQAQHLLYSAFWMLNKSRQGAKLSMMEMESYCNMFGVSDVNIFVRAIQSLDCKLRELNKGGNKN